MNEVLLLLFIDLLPDPLIVGKYTDFRRCMYVVEQVEEYARAEGHTHVEAGCIQAITPPHTAPITSIRPRARA